MPTYDVNDTFWHDWRRLSEEQKALFRAAVRQMVTDLKARRPFAKRLRVKGFQSLTGVYKMSWAK